MCCLQFFYFFLWHCKKKKKKKKKKEEKEEKEKEKEEASWGDKGGRGVQVRFVFWNLLSLYILYRTQINKIVTLYIYILIYLHCTSIPPCVDVCVTTYGIVFLWSQHNVKSKKKKKKLKNKKFKIKRATLSCTLYGRSTVRVKIKKKNWTMHICVVLFGTVQFGLNVLFFSFPVWWKKFSSNVHLPDTSKSCSWSQHN